MSIADEIKIQQLCKMEGVTEEELQEEALNDSVVRGICDNPACNFTRYVEPDQDKGYCTECGTNTVKSYCVLSHTI